MRALRKKSVTDVLPMGRTAVKCTKRFLRMRSYLPRVMSSGAALRHKLQLQDWRDCQALAMCGFEVVGKSDKGTYFQFIEFDMSDVLPRYLRR